MYHILFFILLYIKFFSKIFHRNLQIGWNISFGGQTEMTSELNFVTLVPTLLALIAALRHYTFVYSLSSVSFSLFLPLYVVICMVVGIVRNHFTWKSCILHSKGRTVPCIVYYSSPIASCPRVLLIPMTVSWLERRCIIWVRLNCILGSLNCYWLVGIMTAVLTVSTCINSSLPFLCCNVTRGSINATN